MKSALSDCTGTVGFFAVIASLAVFALTTSAACTAVFAVSERVDDFTDKAHKLFVGAGQFN